MIILFQKDSSDIMGQQRMRWLDDITFEQLWEIVKNREMWCTAVQGVTKSQTWLNNRTTLVSESFINMACHCSFSFLLSLIRIIFHVFGMFLFVCLGTYALGGYFLQSLWNLGCVSPSRICLFLPGTWIHSDAGQC